MNNTINMDSMKQAGCTTADAIEMVEQLAKCMNAPDETEIALIRLNPCLTYWQKRRLIREIRQDMRQRRA